MPKDDAQTKQDKLAKERTECRTMIMNLEQNDQMTTKLRNDLTKLLRRYNKLLQEKQNEAVRDMKTAARKLEQ